MTEFMELQVMPWKVVHRELVVLLFHEVKGLGFDF